MKLSDLADRGKAERLRRVIAANERRASRKRQATLAKAERMIGDSPLCAPRHTSR